MIKEYDLNYYHLFNFNFNEEGSIYDLFQQIF